MGTREVTRAENLRRQRRITKRIWLRAFGTSQTRKTLAEMPLGEKEGCGI